MSPFQVSISLSGHVVAIQMPLTDESMLAAAASNENVPTILYGNTIFQLTGNVTQIGLRELEKIIEWIGKCEKIDYADCGDLSEHETTISFVVSVTRLD